MRLVKVILTVVLGAVGTLLIVVGSSGIALGFDYVAGALTACFALLATGPAISLRPGWRWWIATLIGGAAGSAAAFQFALSDLMCGGGFCPARPPFPLAVLFGLALGGVGLGQALVLKETSSFLIWALGSIIAGAALGICLQVVGVWDVVPEPIRIYVGALVAGAAWGAITSAAVYAVELRRRKSVVA